MFYASKNASHGLEGESAAMISSLAQYLMTNSSIKSDTLILIRNHLGFVLTPHSPPPSHRTPVIAAGAARSGCHGAQSVENRERANIYILLSALEHCVMKNWFISDI